MDNAIAVYPPITLEEFLRFEYHAADKHEFEDGKIFAMAGTSERHNLIVVNLVAALHQATRKSQCKLMAQDMKVLLRTEPQFSYYPDVVVVCDPQDDNAYFKTNPCLIIEVLSDSTHHFDQTEKKTNYQLLQTVKAYMMVHQNKQLIELYRNLPNGTWELEKYTDGSITLTCPETTLTLEQIYEGVA